MTKAEAVELMKEVGRVIDEGALGQEIEVEDLCAEVAYRATELELD